MLVKGQPRAAVLNDLLPRLLQKMKGRFENRPYETLDRLR